MLKLFSFLLPTPNCKLCIWNELDIEYDPRHDSAINYQVCTCQGYKDCDEVYNTTPCRRNYTKSHGNTVQE